MSEKKVKYMVSENGRYLIFDSDDFDKTFVCCEAPEIEEFECEMATVYPREDYLRSVCAICPKEQECVDCIQDRIRDGTRL